MINRLLVSVALHDFLINLESSMKCNLFKVQEHVISNVLLLLYCHEHIQSWGVL